jgi:dihydropyrimidine dehydrogenase (NAD+) subunit PreT
MNSEPLLILAVSGGILVATGTILRNRRRARERRDRSRLAHSRDQGLHIPVSLHPVFDPDVCIGSLACVQACPEGDVIGIVGGVGTLVVGANCIGHGRCAAECPVGAIRLVFGTSERGIDIPRVTPDFESTVPGLYVVGELGGMGLVRNAVRQGVAAVRHLAKDLARERQGVSKGSAGDLPDDLIVLGAGPAGFAAGLAAREAGLRFRIIEQSVLGGAVAHYPRQKIVMTDAIDLPLVGRITRGNVGKEDMISRLEAIRQEFQIPVQEKEHVEDVEWQNGLFRVTTDLGSYTSRKVILTVGRRGTPRRLGVPGEDLPNVTYSLENPEQYAGRSVLVVGGGDSAVEAACSLVEAGARVSLSHRGRAFTRCRPANREQIARFQSTGRVQVRLQTTPLRITPTQTVLSTAEDGTERIAAEYVIICAGGEMPASLLNRVGIEVDRHFGEME